MQPGQFLINKDGGKRKILGVCGEAIIVSRSNDFEFATYPATEKELQNMGWSLLEEPWVPNYGCEYIYLSDLGTRKSQIFDGNTVDLFRLSVGNAFAPHKPRVEEKIELYKQKLIERMGRKD